VTTKKSNRVIILFVLIFTRVLSFAQDSASFNARGFDQFTLGTSRSFYGSTIRFSDSMTYNGVKEYTYFHSFKPPYPVAGVQFLDVLLTFDAAEKLKQIELVKVYTEHLFKDHASRAKQDYETLLSYLQSNWGSKGKSKKHFNSVIAPGREWTGPNTMMWFYLQKNNRNKYHASQYFISIVFKLKDP
jgi:hypothetical protein